MVFYVTHYFSLADALAFRLAALLSLSLRLTSFLGLGNDITLRGIALAGGILVVVIQTAGIEVGLNILGEWFLVKAYHPFDEHGLAVLKLGALGSGQSPAPQFCGNFELLPLLEAVHSFCITEAPGLKICPDIG